MVSNGFAVAMLLLASVAFAQNERGTITGTVTDPDMHRGRCASSGETCSNCDGLQDRQFANGCFHLLTITSRYV